MVVFSEKIKITLSVLVVPFKMHGLFYKGFHTMHISKLRVVNYRNFAKAELLFQKGVNAIIGENGVGKTNLFRAIRLLLDDNMLKSAYKLNESDFHRGLGDWRGHWIVISLEFDEIAQDEAIQALFLHGTAVLTENFFGKATYNLIFRPRKEIRIHLAKLEQGDLSALASLREKITINDYETIFTGRSEANFNDPTVYKELVGDFETCTFTGEIEDPRVGTRLPSFLSLAKEVSFTFIQALRDVVSDFHNYRNNPLLTLLKQKSEEMPPSAITPIAEKVRELNESIEQLEDVQVINQNIRNTLKEVIGETYSPPSLSIKSDLSDEASKLFQSLRFFVGESEENHEGAIHEMSLGGANLMYLTLKLLAFKYQHAHQAIANFLLIEEPEAHMHIHIQKTLFDQIDSANTQIIYSTHSPHLFGASKVQSMNILGRNGNACEAYQPAQGLSVDEANHIQLYLDAVRNDLLFAKSVVLVENDAEEILIPILCKKIFGLSLDELGVSLIHARSTGFKNVAKIFHETRIKKRCSIITDFVASFIDMASTTDETEFEEKYKMAQEIGFAHKADLDDFVQGNPYLSVHCAENTFEIDFLTDNSEITKALVPEIYTQDTTIAEDHLLSENKMHNIRHLLHVINKQNKGELAVLLARHITHKTILPAYISKAIFFARQNLTDEIFVNIYKHRFKCAFEYEEITLETKNEIENICREFRMKNIDLTTLKSEMRSRLPEDQIHDILEPLV